MYEAHHDVRELRGTKNHLMTLVMTLTHTATWNGLIPSQFIGD